MLLSLFEEYLNKHLFSLSTFHPHYETALNKMLLSGGKRFRPMLLLGVVQAYTPSEVEKALCVAMAVEYFHTYSLIHDDLPAMDDASLRRGTPTLHTTYNDALAVLAGDALNTEAFYLISKSAFSSDIKCDLIGELSLAGGARGMVLGQAIDLEFEDKKLSLEELIILHNNKTAKLIASSLKMGAIIAKLDKTEQDKIYALGLELGLLFQMQDDILDVTQSSQEMGKDANQDEHKNSFVNLLGLEKALEATDKKSNQIMDNLLSFDDSFREYFVPILEIYLHRHKKRSQ